MLRGWARPTAVVAVALSVAVAIAVTVLAIKTQWSGSAVVTLVSTLAALVAGAVTFTTSRAEADRRRVDQLTTFHYYASALDAIAAVRALSEEQRPEAGRSAEPSERAQLALRHAKYYAARLAEAGASDEAEEVSSKLRKVLVAAGRADWLFYLSVENDPLDGWGGHRG